MVKSLLQLTIKDILERPLFQKADAYADEQALQRVVKWVHILEVPQVGGLLNGDELILSTGIGWHEDEELSVSFLRQLIDCGASGLCIELGTYTKKPFEKMKQLAEQEHFALIFFYEEVRYIDITQDLHAYFIHQHHRMVSELEALSGQFNQLLLAGKGVLPLLKTLHQATQAQVAFFPVEAEACFYPPINKENADYIYRQWISGELLSGAERKKRNTHRPILAMDHLFADLLLSSKKELSKFDIFALDRCTTAVAQEMMRTRYMEERRRHQEDLWIIEWLNGRHGYDEIKDYLTGLRSSIKLARAAVCVFDLQVKRHSGTWDFEPLLIQKYMVARSIFEGEGFFLLPTLADKQMVFILLDQLSRSSASERMMKGVSRLQQTEDQEESAFFTGLIGIGQEISDFTQLQSSYETAKETIVIQRDVGPLLKPFYSELHAYRMVYMLKKAGQLPAFIEEYIGALVKYDMEKSGELLKTLKVYLTQYGSKQETATELFIVRQTLYHRLEKITALIGDNYMRPDRRIMIELALYAYEYSHGPIH
ncbi:PucR family transcriptional regulator [Paenibacillus solisilvae]|uniref:PucR family transcriptional regulator n=1 Tax=Paenibacillus solisilvae TaxID=2486751 RepID=A0ABW0W6W6_9BACL